MDAEMDQVDRIDDADFAHVVRYAPLVSIDLLISDPANRFLLGLRSNEPARNTLFVPGGRVRKNERLAAAFSRILLTETGVSADLSEAEFAGVYEHFYETSHLGGAAYGTHYVSIAYLLRLDSPAKITIDDQHSATRWLTASELLSAPDVHHYTKAFFQDAVRAKHGSEDQ
jgi:colanic acid biosynthesis protein WcaH